MMIRKMARALALPALLSAGGAAMASEPPAVTPTRPEMKAFLEGSKEHEPRLPLPELTPEEKAEAEAKAKAGELWPVVNNARMRQRYLPQGIVSGGFTRKADPAMSLDDSYKVMMFWIASRANNCAYCLGHQESKLAKAGVGEETVAALDGDWSEFTPAEQAAFALVYKLTVAPQEVGDRDIEGLRAFYNDRQILEILFASAGHNAMNRWTGALNIPQESFRVYATPTSDEAKDRKSRVAPLAAKPRPPLEPRAEVEAKLQEAATRTPRLAPLSEAEARKALPDWPEGSIPGWARLLANFPEAGKLRVVMNRSAEADGKLPAPLKAQIAWIAARNDRAWYALGLARQRLKALGESDDRIFALDGDGAGFSVGERAVFALARKLTVAPHEVGDADVAAVRKHYDDEQTAEVIFQITEAAFLDRVTEPAGLRLEP